MSNAALETTKKSFHYNQRVKKSLPPLPSKSFIVTSMASAQAIFSIQDLKEKTAL